MRPQRGGDRLGARAPAGIEWLASPEEPPLPYDAGLFDFVYAISIWSHFDEEPALRWLEEMGGSSGAAATSS